MSELIVNYDNLLKKIKHKYAIPVAAAKRAEDLEDFGRPRIDAAQAKKAGDNINIAYKELEEGYIKIRNEQMLDILIPKIK